MGIESVLVPGPILKEIKSPAVAAEVYSSIEHALSSGHWVPGQFVLSAFHHETALQCKEKFPAICVGVINDGVLLPSYIEYLRAKGIDNLHVDWANIYMDIEHNFAMRDFLRRNGMQIWVWTVNSIDIYKIVSDYGVDAVFTDRPDLLRDL